MTVYIYIYSFIYLKNNTKHIQVALNKTDLFHIRVHYKTKCYLEWSLIDCTVLRNGGWKCLPFASIDCIFSLCHGFIVAMASRWSVPRLRPSSAPPASPVRCLISLTYFSSCSLSEEPDWCNCLHTLLFMLPQSAGGGDRRGRGL